MNTVILEISECDKCYHFDNAYYNYSEKCTILKRRIISNNDDIHPIPDDCPLLKNGE